jgi:D-xylose 1-dehydrogenase (NADP+, D-xylono-1,5-lactone-forming)
MNKVRWGLLSTANINKRLIPAIRASQRGELVAVASRKQSVADAYATKWEIPRAYGSYEAMLASGEIDAVYIGLPNHLHAAWTIRSLEQGVHVLCEKPFALSLYEVDQMIDAARDSGRVLAEAFMYRHHPQTKKVGEWVRSGRLGKISVIRGVFTFTMDNRENVRLVPEWGGGSLWDIGVYPLSYAQFLMGEPPVWVFGDQWIGPSGVDESFTGTLHYANGTMAQISSDFRTPWYTHVDVLGTKGRLVMNRPFTGLVQGERQLTFVDAEDNSREVEISEQDLYLGEVEDMHHAILDGKATYINLDETRNHVRTVLALYESARRGERVYIEEIN